MSTTEIQGDCPQRFAAVKAAFAQNFDRRGEVGAAFALYQHGEKIIDIWAGSRDRHEQLPWHEDTLVNVFSASKGVVALCALQLHEQGLLDFSAPVANYWPEFAANNKADVLVRHLLCHRSGLAAVWQDVDDASAYDWSSMVRVLERETPYWPPGSAQGYQVFTFGWLVGELIRRISGLSVGNYIREHISEPLGLDFHIGLHKEELRRVADVAPRPAKNSATPNGRQDTAGEDYSAAADGQADNKPVSAAQRNNRKKPDSLMVRALTTPAALFRGTNSTAWRMAEIPAGNGHSNARSLACIYAALAGNGRIGGVKILEETTLPLCSQQFSCETDQVLGMVMRFGPGFMLHCEPGFAFGGGNSFGHFGNGGSLAFADPESGVGIAYVTNRLAHGDRRSKVLVDAVYQSI